MSTATPTSAPKPIKRMSTTAKVFLWLLALLFVVVAGFVFSAWRELNRIPEAVNPTQTNNNVEVLTPNGAQTNTPLHIPTSTQNIPTQTTAEPLTPTATLPANTAKPAATVDNATQAGTPILPTNTPATTPPSTTATPVAAKPAAKAEAAKPVKPNKNTLDHLF